MMTAQGLLMLEQNEGFRAFVYDDATGEPIVRGYTVKGNPTIGYGRLITATHGISPNEARELLLNDVDTVEKQLEQEDWFVELNKPRKDVCINMCFNMGYENFMGFKRMIGAMEEKDFKRAKDCMLDSLWSRQVGSRAVELSEVMKRGSYAI